MQQAIKPRLERRDEKLNSTLVPLFDPTGRLFLASEDPVPVDQDASIQQQQLDLETGVLSINEVRAGRGLPPVAWGGCPGSVTACCRRTCPARMPGMAEPAPSINYDPKPAQDEEEMP